MSTLKQEAVKIIEDIQEDAMVQVIAYLQSVAYDKPQQAKRVDGFRILQSFAGSLPEDFDYSQALEDARKEKYDRFN